jgi:hypothetical protein
MKMRIIIIVVAGLLVAFVAFPLLGIGLTQGDITVYEATSPGAKQALASRIEVLRSALRANRHFEEMKDEPMAFVGSDWVYFDFCSIIYSTPRPNGDDASKSHWFELVPGSDRLAINIRYRPRLWSVRSRARNMVEEVLGAEVVKQLKVSTKRYFIR